MSKVTPLSRIVALETAVNDITAALQTENIAARISAIENTLEVAPSFCGPTCKSGAAAALINALADRVAALETKISVSVDTHELAGKITDTLYKRFQELERTDANLGEQLAQVSNHLARLEGDVAPLRAAFLPDETVGALHVADHPAISVDDPGSVIDSRGSD